MGTVRDLPSGTVTFLFTDIEGSTRLLHELGVDRYAEALAEHRRLLREAFGAHGGVEVDTQGDAFFYAFANAPAALAAASEGTRALEEGPVHVRIGLHTGAPVVGEEGYVGHDVHKAARIAAAGHGGQILLSAQAASLVAGGGLRDLGQHRLKDLSAPERIYQAGEGEFPPLKTLYRTNLPIPATPFLGREQELAELQDLLGRDDVRLLTLLGPGGTGKTRLALQAVAEAAERYPDGVFWVPLATLRDPALVLDAASQALGATDGLAQHVADKRLLILLDNFEHLIAAAPQFAPLLQSCPNLRLVVTSRELLQLAAEQSYPVRPLEPEDGVQLFVARAQAVKPAFKPDEAVRALCERLDNLPLALELAAARIRMLPPQQLLERLSKRLDLLKAGRDADPRQQTLRATIEWSYDLLGEDEQQLFARLAVFRGGCTLDAAEEVCDADLDVLQSLIDKSLVRVRDDERFWMLETIREYAAERFDACGDADEMRRHHAEYFLELAEEAEPNIFASASPAEWVDRVERENDNLRAALDFFDCAGETQLTLRLAGSISDFWLLRGFVAEGARRLEGALAADAKPTRARAKALNGAASLVTLSGNPVAGRRWAEEALALFRKLGDTPGIANSLWAIGYTSTEVGDASAAHEALEESVRLYREVGDLDSAVAASRTLAFSYAETGELERAFDLHAEGLREARSIGNRQIEARSLGSMSFVAADLGRADEALPLVYEAYRIDCELGNRLEIAVDVGRFAKVLTAGGRTELAARLLACSEALCEELEASVPWVTRMFEDLRKRLGAELNEDAFDRAWAEGRTLTADEAVALALTEAESNV
jgi:predicted ATPase/class 3 adenylate cyclase